MQETTSTEFLAWQEYIDLEASTPRREDFYLAQVAAEVRRSIVKNPSTVKVEHFLLKFACKEDPTKQAPTQAEIDQRTATSKARWFAIMKRPGQPPPKGNA